ncbi:AI-2E family transporter [Nakamurella flavida]|uniref:AI-2E family transporter n=1 Tax=Nakamurella flavida TaxID=363630 RepID=A0A939C1G2_9ACTN|nr:AI-2E family transporter [Nakamurella flavida]MBM9477658.1 AI-2E family transporter [Nakamurella flavida]MDP9779208.1 putative PurR-regulated permease PerM [Nakamurella flavida]
MNVPAPTPPDQPPSALLSEPSSELPPAPRPEPSSDTITGSVTPGMRIAAAWSWRFLVVVAALAVVLYAVAFLSEITIPIAIALLLSALLNPVRRFLITQGWRPGLAATTVFVVGLLLVACVIFLVVRQLISGARDLADQVTAGIDQVRNWLVTGPLKLSEDQLTGAFDSIKQAAKDNQDTLTSGAVSTATTAGHVVTGLVLVLFVLFFFLRDGHRIWTWLVGLAPRKARTRIDGAAQKAWTTLAGYVRATVFVAFVDAVGIGIGLLVVGVPLAVPLTALVFLASFIPIVGALVSGVVAVLVALVTVGLVKAIIILAVVIAVQQLESHVLQPVLLGRAVHLHPLAVALAIAGGVLTAGIVGALLAVPLMACLNAAVKHLAGKDSPTAGKDRVEEHLESRE